MVKVGTEDGWCTTCLDSAAEPAARPAVDAPCPTCSGPSRETVGMVCQTCGRDYGSPSTIPDAWRDRRDGRVYVNRRKHAGLPFVFDADSDAEPLWLVPSAPPDLPATRPVVERDVAIRVLHKRRHPGQCGRPEFCTDYSDAMREVDALLASGVVADAADVRRAVAEEIAAAIEDQLSFRNGPQDAARIAREAGESDG